MATMLTTNKLLDDVFALIQDNSTSMRSRMLVFLNNVFQRLGIEADWLFLRVEATISASSNKITLPSDFDRLLNIQRDTDFLLQNCDRLTQEETFAYEENDTTVPIGFIQTATEITFVPGVTDGNVTLRYIKEVPDYADNVTTLFPIQMGNLIKRACLSFYYEYDADDRAMLSVQLDREELKYCRKWFLLTQPMPKLSPHGYIKTRK